MTESEAKTITERDLNCLKQNKALPDSIEAMELSINALENQKKIKEKMLKFIYGTIAVNFIDVIYQVGMLLVCITCLVGSTYNPFLYFRF